MTSILRNLKICTLSKLVSLLLFIAAGQIVFTSFLNLTNVSRIDRTWRQYETHTVSKIGLLNDLRDAIGYGGLIHQFKDFILRKDHRQIIASNTKLRKVKVIVAHYRHLGTSVQEYAALQDINDSMALYRKALAKAERMASQGATSEEIDNVVKISDTEALQALKILDGELVSIRAKSASDVYSAVKNLTDIIVYSAITVGLLLIIAVCALLLFLNLRVFGPVTNIARAIKRLAEGDYTVAVPAIERKDEIGDIARIVNVWKESADEKDQLHCEVKHRAASMNLMNEIAAAANLSSNQTEAFEKSLELICEFTGWEVGHIWELANDGTDNIYPLDCWYLADKERYGPFIEPTMQSVFHFGEGVPGRVCTLSEAAFVCCIENETDCPRMKAAETCGLISCVGVPVKIREEVVTVLEFFSSTSIEPNPQLIEILTHIGTQMGRVVERSNAAQVSYRHMEQLEVLIGNATDELKVKANKLEGALTREKKLNATQRQFVSMASHEFRTPLAIIDGTAQRLQRRKDKANGEEIERRIGKIRSAVIRMSSLMESMLSAERMEEGKLNIEISQCHIRDIVEDVCACQQGITQGNNIRLDLSGLPETIQADTNMLHHVFTNLLSNAIKYSPDMPNILVKGWSEETDVLISVQDNGLGIDEEDLSKMFGRYFRAKTSIGIAGTGIGLNLAKAIIEQHSGQIAVESKKGEGSTFTVRMPIAGPEVQAKEMGEALGIVA